MQFRKKMFAANLNPTTGDKKMNFMSDNLIFRFTLTSTPLLTF